MRPTGLSSPSLGDDLPWENNPFVPVNEMLTRNEYKRHKSANSEDDDEQQQQNREEEEEEKEEKEYFIPVPLPSKTYEKTLGDPGPRANCFGCCYYGEKDTTIPSEALVKLIEMSRQSVGRICLVTLAHGMADYYDKKIRQPINAKLPMGERPLPYWPAAQILDHIYNHTQDPLLLQVVLLAKTKEVVNELEECLFEKSSKTGIKKPNKYNIECYDKMVKLLFLIQKQDASKMAFHSAGARINPEILEQGILTTHNKKLHAYLRK